MGRLFRGRCGGLIAFLGISTLVLGGLGWATKEALRLEEEQQRATCDALRLEQEKRLAIKAALLLEEDRRVASEQAREADQLRQIQRDHADRLRQAMWRLDTRLTPALAREDSRPYANYVALHSPFPALSSTGAALTPGQFYLPSPLLTAPLPEWMILHFQIDSVNGWTSPQVIPDSLQKFLRQQPIELAIDNVSEPRRKMLQRLKSEYPAGKFLALLKDRGIDHGNLAQQNGSDLFPPGALQQIQQMPGSSLPALQQGQAPSNPTLVPLPNLPSNSGPGEPTNSSNNLQLIQNPRDQQAVTREQGDGFKRYEVTARAKTEGQRAFWNEGRHINPLENIYPSKVAKVTEPVDVALGSMQALWLPDAMKPQHLLMVRSAKVGDKPAVQGIVLDWKRIQELLKAEIEDLFPNARLVPLNNVGNEIKLDRTMTALPVELDPGVEHLPEPANQASNASTTAEGTIDDTTDSEESHSNMLPRPSRWTPLRIGLIFAWTAAIVALLAVGLGGWSLFSLSERRIRFVSAVTHELRTPLTTLRLYLDLLTSGLIRDEKQKTEYLNTLNGEAERLNRLITNVLDFARLEKTCPKVERETFLVSDFLAGIQRTWEGRCHAHSKELCLVPPANKELMLLTDRKLIEQIVSNLIDNACKYSKEATDPRIWIRIVHHGGTVHLEVEDRGPGVTNRERGSIFRPFRRGRDADVKAGGVGLGLALATRWATLLGGRLTVGSGSDGTGACFRLELPGSVC